jgi:hypothetical protein
MIVFMEADGVIDEVIDFEILGWVVLPSISTTHW